MNIKARRKHVAKRYSRILGVDCYWRNGQLFGPLFRPYGSDEWQERAVKSDDAPGKIVTLNKQGAGTASTA